MTTIGALRREEAIANPPVEGTLIDRTHRPEDLIPAFADALDGIYAQKPRDVLGTVVEARSWALGEKAFFEDFPETAMSYDEVGTEIVAELIDHLQDAAPDGMYFGAHAGDGADFGFWETEEPSPWVDELDEIDF